MAENDDPPAAEPAANRPPPSQPRRNISAERQQTPPPAGEIKDQLANLVGSMMVLANHIGNETAAAESAPDRAGRRVKKFQRSGTVDDRLAPAPNSSENSAREGVDKPAPAGDTAKQETEFNRNVAWPRPVGGEQEPEPAEVVPRPNRKRRNKKVVLLVVQAAGFSLLVLGFLAGQLSVSPEPAQGETVPPAKAPDGGGVSRVSERVMQTANEAMHAARKGDVEGARKLFTDALDRRVELPGIYYQLARLTTESGDLFDAGLSLDHSTAVGEFVAPACYSRARFAAMKGNYAEVTRQLQIAAHTDPFNGRYLFYWGEALRRRGQTQTSIEVLGHALDRAHTAEEETLYLFKQRLAKVESGDDSAFNAELDANLKQASVTPEWWLLAAARDITRSAFPAAAESLKKAASLLPPATYALRVKDYLFQTVRNEPALSALLQVPSIQDSAEANGPFPDPVTLPAFLADPAIWSVDPIKNKSD